jgi:shikimate kinase
VVNEPDQIVLVGLPGAGKSTVGRILAELLGWRFVDLDVEIEQTAYMTVSALFESKGESEFRRLETELTGRLASQSQLVLAPGGGWVMNPANSSLLADALLIWLRVDPETAWQRLRDTSGKRPLLAGADPLQRIQQLAQQRRSRYEQAHAAFDTDKLLPRQIAEMILEWLTRQKKSV